MGFSVGIGLTNACNLKCPHCYRPDQVEERLTLGDVQRACESIPVRSMNLGVGENGLHSQYGAILEYLWTRSIKTSITSNGFSIEALDDGLVKRFHSVEFSLDFPSESEHDAFRGGGNWRTVMAGLERCVTLGVSVTITAVMMSVNYDRLVELAGVAGAFGANLRVNVYQPSRTDRFTLSYAQFWNGFRRLAEATRLVATTEPVLAGVLELPDFAGPGCGRSTVRVAPDGRILPCTYWPSSRLRLGDLARLGLSGRLRRAAGPDRPDRRRRPLLPVRAGRAPRARLGTGQEPGSSQSGQRLHDGRGRRLRVPWTTPGVPRK
jgi:MoaA/NifB/PqqE/SkfB family radical SAM enzyme